MSIEINYGFKNPNTEKTEFFDHEVTDSELATIVNEWADLEGVRLDGTDSHVSNFIYDVFQTVSDSAGADFQMQLFIECLWDTLTENEDNITPDIQAIINTMQEEYLEELEEDRKEQEKLKTEDPIYQRGWEDVVDEFCINETINENNMTDQFINEILTDFGFSETEENRSLYREGRTQGKDDIKDVFDGRDYFEPGDIEDYEDWQQEILRQYLD